MVIVTSAQCSRVQSYTGCCESGDRRCKGDFFPQGVKLMTEITHDSLESMNTNCFQPQMQPTILIEIATCAAISFLSTIFIQSFHTNHSSLFVSICRTSESSATPCSQRIHSDIVMHVSNNLKIELIWKIWNHSSKRYKWEVKQQHYTLIGIGGYQPLQYYRHGKARSQKKSYANQCTLTRHLSTK